jgi:alpha-L-rhamnosidase
MENWVNFLRGFAKDGILANDQYGDWCCPPEDKNLIHSKQQWRKTPKEILATSYYYHVLTRMADYAELMGNQQDVTKYRTEAGQIKQAFNQHLYNAEGYYGNGSQTSQILPIRFGMVPADIQKKTFDYLVNHIETKTGGAIGTGLIGGQWLMRTLSDNGRLDIAYRFATSRQYPSWGYMIDNGATTIWELWNGNTADPAMNSGNHVMLLGDVVIWMFEYLGGIQSDPAQPGFKHIIMNPRIVGDLTFARTEHNCPYGLIKSSWKLDADTFKWSITIPPNTTATVYIPAAAVADVTENTNPADKAQGVKFLRMEKDRAIFSVGSGSYEFISKKPRPGTGQ